jgi:hypothetical protein
MHASRDGNREISVAELTATMRELGDLLSPEEIAAFVGMMDRNDDGVIAVRTGWPANRAAHNVSGFAQLTQRLPALLAACTQFDEFRQMLHSEARFASAAGGGRAVSAAGAAAAAAAAPTPCT